MSGTSSDDDDSDHSIDDTHITRALSPTNTTDTSAADQLKRVRTPSTESTAESSSAMSPRSVAASSSRSLPVSTHRKQKKNTREKRRRSELNTKFDIIRDLLDMNQTKSKAKKTAVLSHAITVIRRWKRAGNNEILVARQAASSMPQAAAAHTITAPASFTATTAVLIRDNLQRYTQSAPVQLTPLSMQQQPLSVPLFNSQRPPTHLMHTDVGQTTTQMLPQYNHNVQPHLRFVPIRQSAELAIPTRMSVQLNAAHLTQRAPLTSSQSPEPVDAVVSESITSSLQQAKAADISGVSTRTSADKQSPLPIAQQTPTSPVVYDLQSPTVPQPLFYPYHTLPRAPSQLHSHSQPAMSTQQQQHSQYSPVTVSYAQHHQLPIPMHFHVHPLAGQQPTYSRVPIIYQIPFCAGGQSQTVDIAAQPLSMHTSANSSATNAITTSAINAVTTSSSPMSFVVSLAGDDETQNWDTGVETDRYRCEVRHLEF